MHNVPFFQYDTWFLYRQSCFKRNDCIIVAPNTGNLLRCMSKVLRNFICDFKIFIIDVVCTFTDKADRSKAWIPVRQSVSLYNELLRHVLDTNIYLVLRHEETYVMKVHSISKNKYSEEDIIKMLEFLVDNIFVSFLPENSTKQSAFKYVQNLPLSLSTSFMNHTKRISYSPCSKRERNSLHLGHYLGQMYPAELEIKNTTESNISASYFD